MSSTKSRRLKYHLGAHLPAWLPFDDLSTMIGEPAREEIDSALLGGDRDVKLMNLSASLGAPADCELEKCFRLRREAEYCR